MSEDALKRGIASAIRNAARPYPRGERDIVEVIAYAEAIILPLVEQHVQEELARRAARHDA